MQIKEVIIVEGRDDTAAVKRAVAAETIETHGYGIRKQTWELIQKAHEEKGIIVFTDPDHAGQEIRKRIKAKFPYAKEAFLSREQATEAGDIGIENAAPEHIQEALQKAHCTLEETRTEFDMCDMQRDGLAGGEDSKAKREEIGSALGIGYGNTKAFLNKLNKYGVTREEYNEALLTYNNKSN